MAEMLVMRRANGDLFSKEINGQPRILVWSSRAACARYRERNPELLTYLPARLDEALLRRIAGDTNGARHATFFLIAEDAPDASLDRGRSVAPDELLLTCRAAGRARSA
ncbi:MAG TPA: hypothetical protein VKA60_01915 [Blastocatellia bacterium]|nr:hypothetical protein [Blastocatellia bacterium]